MVPLNLSDQAFIDSRYLINNLQWLIECLIFIHKTLLLINIVESSIIFWPFIIIFGFKISLSLECSPATRLETQKEKARILAGILNFKWRIFHICRIIAQSIQWKCIEPENHRSASPHANPCRSCRVTDQSPRGHLSLDMSTWPSVTVYCFLFHTSLAGYRMDMR